MTTTDTVNVRKNKNNQSAIESIENTDYSNDDARTGVTNEAEDNASEGYVIKKILTSSN